MEILIHDWMSLILRWLHVITGIAWIGSSFYFMWLDQSLRKHANLPVGAHGESWSVHGGGFYHVQKYLVAPERMPEELHWFKWESYMTWISGFSLMAIVYYWGAESYLIDRSVMDITTTTAILISVGSLVAGWAFYDVLCRSPLRDHGAVLFVVLFAGIVAAAYGYSLVFSGRAAFVHVGAMVATMMSANVFMVIIPNQKKVVAVLKAGGEPDPVYGKIAKLRSSHNNYLTLPVLFMMISNHYPMTFGHDWNWLIVAFVLAIGAIVRDFFNCHNAGMTGKAIQWQWPVAAILMAGLIALSAWKPGGEPHVGDDIYSNDAFAIVQTHCAGCHSAMPANESFDEAPGGIMFDTVDMMKTSGLQIMAQAVLSDAMPLGNMTGMTDEERAKIGAWIKAGMPDD
jgi:uncharacterized membrane protein